MILAHLDWSERAAPILEQMRLREREPYPSELPVLAEQPDIGAAGAIALKAWNATSSERAIGMGVGPIPQSAIDRWCDRHLGRDPIAADFLCDVLRHVDNVVLTREAAKQRMKGATS
jgi:hypothetical protein